MKPSRIKGLWSQQLLLPLGLVLFCVGCGRSAEEAGDRRDFAFSPVPTFGELVLSDASSLPFLISGWGVPESSSGGRNFVPGMGAQSTILLPSVESVALVVTLEGRPFPLRGDIEVTATVEGQAIGSQRLAAGGGAVTFDIPAALAGRGSTQLELGYAAASTPTFPSAEKVILWQKLSYRTVGNPPENLLVGLWPDQYPAADGLQFDRGDSSGPVLRPASDSTRFSTQSRVSCREADAPRTPNIVLYLIDTLRADRVGAYGNLRGLTPALDALAEKSLVLEQAVAQSPWTRPSVASLMTGLTPLAHGVVGRKSALASEFLTLAEVLSAQGYATVGFVTNPNASGKYGLRQGFDRYVTLSGKGASAKAVSETAEQWIAERDSAKPFFMYLHTVEPHAPYQPAPPFARRFASEVENPERYKRKFMQGLRSKQGRELETVRREMELLYDAEVAENDAALGDLLETLGDPSLENTVVIVVSDHGEEFLEHGRWEHGKSLHTEVLDVPFVIYLPDCAAGRVQRTTQHVDLLPTLLDYLGLPPLPGLPGESILCTNCGPRAVVSHVGIDRFFGTSLTTADLRYIDTEGQSMGGRTTLYDLVNDPEETTNVLLERPIGALFFATQLASLSSTSVAAPEVDDSELDPEMVRRLRSLGYID